MLNFQSSKRIPQIFYKYLVASWRKNTTYDNFLICGNLCQPVNGPERYGILSYALSFVWLFSSLASFGLDDILVRELVKLPDQRQNLIGTVFWLKNFWRISSWAPTIAIVMQFKTEDQQTYWLIAIITFGFIFQLQTLSNYIFKHKSSLNLLCEHKLYSCL